MENDNLTQMYSLGLNLLESLNIKHTNKIDLYRNTRAQKCLNEFEYVDKISRGLIWKVKKVLRYFYDEMKNIQSTCFALKKTHIKSLISKRYYVNDKIITYFDKIFEEIKIYSLINNEHENIIKLYEVIYNPDHEYIYLICEFADLGTLMIKHPETFKYFHNFKIIKFLIKKYNLDYDLNSLKTKQIEHDLHIIENSCLSINLKNTLCKILFKQIFYGLKFLEQINVSHRDLKPDNIVFTSKDSMCKIIDFSISCIVSDKLINQPGGSIHFCAPELFDYTNKGLYNPFIADIWSVGICMYLFLVGDFPFDSDSELELQLKICKGDINYPKEFPADALYLLKLIFNTNPYERISDVDSILQHSYFKSK